MKKLVLMIAVLLLALAQTALAEIKVSGDAYVGVFDKYLWRGYNFSENSAVAQGGMDLSANGLTVSYWTNGQFKDDNGLQGGDAYETDITLDYSMDLGELVSLSAGNIYYTLDGLNDTNELYLGVTLNTLLSPTLKAYYDWDEIKDSRFYTLSIGHSLELGKITLNAGALASYMEGTDNLGVIETNVPWNAELSLSADVAVTDQITVTPSFLYSSPLSDDAQATIDTEMVSGLTVSLSF